MRCRIFSVGFYPGVALFFHIINSFFTFPRVQYHQRIRKCAKRACVGTKKRMTDISLQNLIQEMAGGAHMDRTADAFTPVDAWESLLARDLLLAMLQKDQKEARARYEQLLRAHGPHDPMTVVARDVMDSAQSAFDTRLIEVRQDQKIDRTAQQDAVMTRLDAARNEISRRRRTEQQAFRQKKDTEDKARKAAREAAETFLLTVFFFYMLQRMLTASRRRLALAAAFLQASLTPAHEHNVA